MSVYGTLSEICSAIEKHYQGIGLAVENFDQRLSCYELHVGLEHIAYAAFTGRDDHLHAIARRTLQVLELRSD